AVRTGGRIQVVTGNEFTTGTVAGNFSASAGSPFPSIWEYNGVLSLTTAHLVSSIDFTWILGFNHPEFPSRTAIFGISTSLDGSSPYVAAPLTSDSFNQDVVVEA